MVSPEILRRFSFFAGFDPALIKEVAMLGEEMVFAAGAWIFHAEDQATALYLIVSGTVELKIPYGGGKKYADLEQLVEGELTGWSALVEPYVYTSSATTPTGARLVKIAADGLRDLLEQHPEAGYKLMSHLAKEISSRLTNLRVRFVSLVEA